MTYEGSTTHPGCWETAVWLILNKPIYVTAREVSVDPLYLPSISASICIPPSTLPPLPLFFFSFYCPSPIGQLVKLLRFESCYATLNPFFEQKHRERIYVVTDLML